MKKIILILILIFSVGAISFGAPAKLTTTKFTEDVDFNGARLSDALALMSKITKTTIVADSEAKDSVIDLYITKGQTLREVLDIINLTNGLEEVYMGKIVMLTHSGKGSTTFLGKVQDNNKQGIEGAIVTLGDSGYDSTVTVQGGAFVFDGIRPGVYIIKLSKKGYRTSSEVVEIKQNKVTNMNIYLNKENEEGQIHAKIKEGIRNKELGTSIGSDGSEQVTERIQLKHAFADDVKSVVDSILGKEVIISAFSKLHMIVIKGNPESVNTAKKLIDDLDRTTKQVRITAQVLDTTDNLFEDLGFNWLLSNKSSDINAAQGNTGGSVGILPVVAGAVSGSSAINFIDIFNDGKNLLTASVSMLQNTEDLSISSVPSVVIVNGENAEFKVTEEVIVGEIKKSEGGDKGSSSVSQPIFEEAGTIFTVTPTIRDGVDGPDTIILDISSEVSDFKLTKAGTYNNKGGSKIKSDIRTKIQVKDGDVIFIGGLKKTTVKETVNKLPILGDIPVLGALFRNTSTTNNIRQVYIQITAEIVDYKNKNSEIDLSRFKENPATTGELKRIYPKFENDNNGEGL